MGAGAVDGHDRGALRRQVEPSQEEVGQTDVVRVDGAQVEAGEQLEALRRADPAEPGA